MWFANIGSLSKHFRVHAIDTIGQPGRSIPSKPLTASTTAEWLLGLMDKLSIKKANLAGVSLGGWIILDLAIRHPNRTNRIALLGPAASFASMRFTWILHSLFPIMIFPTRNWLIRYFRWLTRGMSVNAQWGELMVQGILNCKPPPPVRARPFTDLQLAGCSIPALVLAGEKSVIYDPKKAVMRATILMPALKTDIIADASHGLVYEQAERVDSDVITFLKEKNKSTTSLMLTASSFPPLGRQEDIGDQVLPFRS